MSNSKDANCPGIPQCCQPVYGYNYTQSEFLSAAQTASCPDGSTGGPFKVQEAAFYSDISQADADQKATDFLNSLLAAGCVYPTPSVTLVFSALSGSPVPTSTLTVAIDGGSPVSIVAGTVYTITESFAIAGHLTASTNVTQITQGFTVTPLNGASITFNSGSSSFMTNLGSAAIGVEGDVTFGNHFSALYQDTFTSHTSYSATATLSSPVTVTGSPTAGNINSTIQNSTTSATMTVSFYISI